MRGRCLAATGGPFTHTMVTAATTGELTAIVVPFVRAALARGDAVHVNLSADRLAAVRRGLGSDGAHVDFTDAATWEPHPVRRLRAIHAAVDRALSVGAPRLRFVGECAWPPDDPFVGAEWARFDAVLNRTLAELPVTMVCVYDPVAHPPAVLERGRASHPYAGLVPTASDHYVEPEQILAADRPERLAVPGSAVRLVGPGAATVRAQLAALLLDDRGGEPGALAADLVDGLLVAVTELVTNGRQAGAESVHVASWREGSWAVVQVDDDGPGLHDVLAGYRPPSADALDGRGLWITRQLADAVEVASGDWGTSVRVRLRCGGPTATM